MKAKDVILVKLESKIARFLNKNNIIYRRDSSVSLIDNDAMLPRLWYPSFKLLMFNIILDCAERKDLRKYSSIEEIEALYKGNGHRAIVVNKDVMRSGRDYERILNKIREIEREESIKAYSNLEYYT